MDISINAAMYSHNSMMNTAMNTTNIDNNNIIAGGDFNGKEKSIYEQRLIVTENQTLNKTYSELYEKEDGADGRWSSYSSATEFLNAVTPFCHASKRGAPGGFGSEFVRTLHETLRNKLYYILIDTLKDCLFHLGRQDKCETEKQGAVRIIISCLGNPLAIKTLQNLGAVSNLRAVAFNMPSDQPDKYIQNLLWIMAKVGGADALYEYLKQESRENVQLNALWILGHREVLLTASEKLIRELVQITSRNLNIESKMPDHVYHNMRLLGHSMALLKPSSMGVDEATNILHSMNAKALQIAEDKELWSFWLWTAAHVASTASQPLESKEWNQQFSALPILDTLNRYWEVGSVVKETVQLCFLGMPISTYLHEIIRWTEFLPRSFDAVTLGLKKLLGPGAQSPCNNLNEARESPHEGNIDDGDDELSCTSPPHLVPGLTPADSVILLNSVLPSAAKIEGRVEKECVLEAALQLASAAIEGAACESDEHNTKKGFQLLLESITSFEYYHKLVFVCVTAFQSVIMRCPGLLSLVAEQLKNRVEKIYDIHRGNTKILEATFSLLFAMGDFKYIMHMLEVTSKDPSAVQTSMKVAAENLTNGMSSDWNKDVILQIGNFATRRLSDLRTQVGYREAQACCAQVVTIAAENVCELQKEETFTMLFVTFCDLWSDIKLACRCLSGINSLLGVLTTQQRFSLQKQTQPLLTCVNQALRLDNIRPQYEGLQKEYEMQLRLTKFLLEGIDSGFEPINLKDGRSIMTAVAAAESFLRSSVKESLSPQEIANLKQKVEKIKELWENYDEALASKCHVVLGYLPNAC